jgi:hypothetical protein
MMSGDCKETYFPRLQNTQLNCALALFWPSCQDSSGDVFEVLCPEESSGDTCSAILQVTMLGWIKDFHVVHDVQNIG